MQNVSLNTMCTMYLDNIISQLINNIFLEIYYKSLKHPIWHKIKIFYDHNSDKKSLVRNRLPT